MPMISKAIARDPGPFKIGSNSSVLLKRHISTDCTDIDNEH